MRKLYLIFSLILIAGLGHAQTPVRIVSGQLRSTDDQSPLPGVNVIVKGTATGTTTDANGYYSLTAPVGSILVFSFVGMQTREVVVTATGLQAVNGTLEIKAKPTVSRWNPSILVDTAINRQKGVAILGVNSPTYVVNALNFAPEDIIAIRRTGKLQAVFSHGHREKYLVYTNNDRYTLKGLRIEFNNSISLQRASALPSVQSSYSQGRNVEGTMTWLGPEQKEMMNWGPPIKTLEYTGNSYPYDSKGSIVVAGSGNGRPVQSYDPFPFLRTGFTTTNEIIMYFPGLLQSTTRVDWEHKHNNGIVRNNDSRTDNVSFYMKRIKISNSLSVDASGLFSSSSGRLLNRGSNLTNIMSSMMTTSTTFDNTNGYAPHVAAEHGYASRLPNGTVRSSAPGLIDNPYGLVNEMPDHETMTHWVSTLGANYKVSEKLSFNTSATLDKQNSFIVHGVSPDLAAFAEGRRTERTEIRDDASFNFNSLYKLNNDDEHRLTLSFGYAFRNENRNVTRMDGFGFSKADFADISSADSISNQRPTLSRATHEAIVQGNIEYRAANIQLSNRSYFSNTLNNSQYVNLFPALSLKSNLAKFLDVEFLDVISPYASISRTLREAPLFFGNNAALSVPLHVSQYKSYFEDREIAWSRNLTPETEVKFETGVNMTTSYDLNLKWDIAYYNNTTYDLVLPIWVGGQPVLQNAATVNNRGVNASVIYDPWNSGDVRWSIAMRWNKYNTIVRRLNIPGDIIPLSGFNEIQTVASKGNPLGAIYGTTFLVDNKGHRIIGDDGFPLVDPHLRKIGNPIPHYLVTLEPTMTIKQKLRINFILDFKKGGQVWNGTKAVLNYYGRGKDTEDQRNISNYTFDGVNTNGIVNTVPVRFYDPGIDLQKNRWVRYGISGIGQEHIEDASWIRLNEASLSYDFYLQHHKSANQFSISFIGKNLFLITPYSGVDPGTALYGYNSANGLDLFNAPSLRSYHFQITIKL